MRFVWLILGVVSLVLASGGIILPLVPTVPFLLLSAFFFARSSPTLLAWLLDHKIFGPPIQNWRRHGSISLRAKIFAGVSIIVTLAISIFFRVPSVVLIVQIPVLIVVLVFIWSRPRP